MGKCTFQKLNEKTAKRATMGRPKATKKSIARTESIRKNKIKRLKEFQSWWK